MANFESLWKSAQRGELILIDGGFCRFHLRKDRQLTIYEIISLRPGAGSEMLEQLRQVEGTTSIFARCPVDLDANRWYKRRGFVLEAVETTRTGRQLNCWRLSL
ncbi:MAG: N-acetyltransferase [Candidatus Altiarchaeales archaeon]|nr:N-acetyltransferase [Candidatus Altiarchaeales archaeon]